MHLCLEAAVNFSNPLLEFATSLISMTSCDNEAEQKTAPKIPGVCFKTTRWYFNWEKSILLFSERGNEILFVTLLGHLWCDWAVITLWCLLSKLQLVLLLSWLFFSQMRTFPYLVTFYRTYFFSGYHFNTECKLYLRRIYRKLKWCFLVFFSV